MNDKNEAYYHLLLSDAYSVIDPDEHPELTKRIFEAIEDCDKAMCHEWNSLCSAAEEIERLKLRVSTLDALARIGMREGWSPETYDAAKILVGCYRTSWSSLSGL